MATNDVSAAMRANVWIVRTPVTHFRSKASYSTKRFASKSFLARLYRNGAGFELTESNQKDLLTDIASSRAGTETRAFPGPSVSVSAVNIAIDAAKTSGDSGHSPIPGL